MVESINRQGNYFGLFTQILFNNKIMGYWKLSTTRFLNPPTITEICKSRRLKEWSTVKMSTKAFSEIEKLVNEQLRTGYCNWGNGI